MKKRRNRYLRRFLTLRHGQTDERVQIRCVYESLLNWHAPRVASEVYIYPKEVWAVVSEKVQT